MPPSHSVEFYLSQWKTLPALPKGPLLEGKTAIITGSNGGLGLETAFHFASFSPGRLILAVRNLSSGAEALDQILKKFPKVRAEVWELDLGKYASVKAFAQRAEKELDKVDILVNNAGQNPGFKMKPLQRTEDGHEQVVQVNVLSTTLLSLLLQPLLSKSPDPRLTIVSSEVHAWANTTPIKDACAKGHGILADFDDDKIYLNPTRYFQSKLLLQMVVRKLIPALPNLNIVAVNPGLCRTNLVRDRPKVGLATLSLFAWYYATARSPEVGARNVTTAALLAKDSAESWSDCQPRASTSTFLGSGIGFKATEQFWAEILEEMERVAPGSTKCLEI